MAIREDGDKTLPQKKEAATAAFNAFLRASETSLNELKRRFSVTITFSLASDGVSTGPIRVASDNTWNGQPLPSWP